MLSDRTGQIEKLEFARRAGGQVVTNVVCNRFHPFNFGMIAPGNHLGLHRIIRQGSSARDFVPVQSFKNGGILYVFPVFETAEMVQKIR